MGWIHNLSVQTLGKIAGVGGVILLGTASYLQGKLRQQLRSTPMYQSAMDVLKKHPGALSLLGEPIQDGAVKIDYRDNFCDGQKAKYKIPVSGPKDKAYYYFWAERNGNEFVVTKGELELRTDPSRRLVIVKENKVEDLVTSLDSENNKVKHTTQKVE